MLKKLLMVLMAFLIITGCGNNNLNNIDIDKASESVESTLQNMTDVKTTTLEDVYGMDLSKLDEYVIRQNDNGDFYAIIKTNDKGHVKAIMTSYFEKMQEYDEAYAPERLDLLSNRVEKEVGEYLIYIVAADANTIYDDIIDTMD